MLSALFFIGSLIGASLTSNGLRRRSLWLPAMITNELPLHHIVWQAVVDGEQRPDQASYDEMRAFDWQGDPEPHLTYLHRFTVPEQSLGE